MLYKIMHINFVFVSAFVAISAALLPTIELYDRNEELISTCMF